MRVKDSSRRKSGAARGGSEDPAGAPDSPPPSPRDGAGGVAELMRLARLTADIGIALTQGDTLGEMLSRCTDALVRHLDAAFARIWTLDARENVLELQASSGMYTHLDGAHARVPVGQFKIGLIAEERRAHLTNEVVGDPRVGDQEWAAREGMVAFAGYPLVVEDRLVGVMGMFARRPLTELTLEAMSSVANGIALGVERKRADAALRESERRFARIARATNDAVWDWNLLTNKVWWNEGVHTLFGYAEDEVSDDSAWWYEHIHPEDRARVVGGIHALINGGGTAWAAEYRFARADGTHAYVADRGHVERDAAGGALRAVGGMADITARKEAEALLARAGEERERMLEEVSTPLVPVLEGVLVMPLIGSLDTARMQRATQAALDEVRRTGARACIIDITGARLADSRAVANLSNLVAALRLTGAAAVVTGITAEAARSIVALGLDLSGMRTHRTLAEALSEFINRGASPRGGRPHHQRFKGA